MTERVVVRRGVYHDSVTLMQVSRQAEELPGVTAAAAVAATPVNLELLARQGFAVDAKPLGPNDLVLCVRADGEDAAEAAVEAIGRLLAAGLPCVLGHADFASRVALLQIGQRRDPVVRVVIGREFAQPQHRAVMLDDGFDRAGRVIGGDRAALDRAHGISPCNPPGCSASRSTHSGPSA